MKRPTRRARAARTHDVRVARRWKPAVTHLSRWTARLGPGVAVVRAFYSNRRAWLALLVSAVILTYGGGAVLFWFHAIYLGEGGPAISPWLHWVLDSTAGFVGLTPPITVILPLAAWIARQPAASSVSSDPVAEADFAVGSRLAVGSSATVEFAPGAGAGHTAVAGQAAGTARSAAVATRRVHPLRFAVAGGVLMAVVTAPGPVLHDLLVARGTFIGDKAEQWFGNGSEPTGGPQEVSWLAEAGQQVGAGLPVYVTMFVVDWLVVHRLVRWRAA